MELTGLIAVITTVILTQTTYLTIKAVQPTKVKNSVLLDTSVLIDGRIVSIARSGLISAKLIVPRSVVRELQFMADKADHDKRERARFGLDVIEQLQSIDTIDLEVIDDGVTSESGVDEQLMNLAKKWQAKLCTIDYNLNKSARVQGVQIININELAHALRVLYLPGETMEIKLQQPGQESHQAVGYLDDGTMVVVDNAKAFIGRTLRVEATRVLQTAAGKMMFAKHHEKVNNSSSRSKKTEKASPKPSGHGAAAKNRTQKNHKASSRSREDAVVALANNPNRQK